MVNAQVVSSNGMFIQLWMLFTSMFTCICYRIYIHKINVTCHKHTWWVKEVNKVYINPKIFRIWMLWNLNILQFWKRFQILKGLYKLKSFQNYQKFSENDFTVLTYFVTELILKNVLKSMIFIFGIGEKPISARYYGIDGYFGIDG